MHSRKIETLQHGLRGAIPALITPWRNNTIDDHALNVLIGRFVDAHCTGIVIAGSTGEGILLQPEELLHLARRVRTITPQHICVVTGLCHPSSSQAAMLAQALEQTGIDGLMVTVPPYLRPNDAGIIQHYQYIAQRSSLPLLMYNIPKRTGTNVSLAVISQLSECGVIQGIKESADNADRIRQILDATQSNFIALCGDDAATPFMIESGCKGTISVLTNLYPKTIQKIHNLLAEGKHIEARELSATLAPLQACLEQEPNPQGIKFALSTLSICDSEVRAPLVPCAQETQQQIRTQMQHQYN